MTNKNSSRPDSAQSRSDECAAPETANSRYRQIIPEVFDVPDLTERHFPAVVIGSGFGGAVAALRLAEKGVKTAVLERGFRWPQSRLRETFSPAFPADGRGYWYRTDVEEFPDIQKRVDLFGGVLDYTEYANMTVARGACVGGGSLAYSGTLIQPKREYFEQIFGDSVAFDEMNSVYYPRAREVLRASPAPDEIFDSPSNAHMQVWRYHMERAGYEPERLDSGFDWDVVLGEDRLVYRRSVTVGESDLGNANGAKFDLTHNYLKLAEQTGNAAIYPGYEVRKIVRAGERYQIHVIRRTPDRPDAIAADVITCDALFLAAGSVGTSEMLTRAKALDDIPGLNEHIGQGWGSNGDVYALRRWPPLKDLVQSSPNLEMIHDTSLERPITVENLRVYKERLHEGLLGLISMVFDMEYRGRFVYNPETDDVDLIWPEKASAYYAELVRTLIGRIAAAATETTQVEPPAVAAVSSDMTPHPLGGVVIGKATDKFGRVHGATKLYVIDGALIPGASGAVNPALTITALAERNIETILNEDFAV